MDKEKIAAIWRPREENSSGLDSTALDDFLSHFDSGEPGQRSPSPNLSLVGASYAEPDNSWRHVPVVLQYGSTHGNSLDLYPSSSSCSEPDPDSPGTIESALSHLVLNSPSSARGPVRDSEAKPGSSPATDSPMDQTTAKHFVLNIVTQDQMAHTPIIFYIEATPGQLLYDVSHFIIQVQSPCQACPTVTVEEDRCKKRFICSFRSMEPGSHFISIRLAKVPKRVDASNHIENSPNFVTVKLHNRALPTVVTRILTDGRIKQDAPGLTISPTSKIWGLTNDPEQQLIYAADRGGHEVLVFSMHTDQITLVAKFSAPAPVDGLPFRPTGIHFSAVYQLLYVTDKDNHRVCIFETDGQLLMSFGKRGHQDGQLKYPWGVAVSPDGELVAVADSKNHRLQLFNKHGRFLRKYSVCQAHPFRYRNPKVGLDLPRGVCFNEEGNLVFISDFNLHNVISVDVGTLEDRKSICPLHRLIRPQGITMHPGENLLVCDSRSFGGGAIRIIHPSSGGGLTGTMEGTSTTRFQMPLDITVCHGGKLCVVDCGGTRLTIF